MPIIRPTYDEVVRRTWQQVREKTGLTNDSESGIAYSIVKVVIQEIMNLWDELEYVDSQGMLTSATGTNLDKIGEFFGVVRRSSSAAGTIGGPNSVKFTNNGVASITVPSNTRVWSSSDPEIAYFTVFSTLIQGGSEAYIDVKAAAAGEFFNVGAGKLDTHNVGITNLSVTNELPITNGLDLETDANYRLRIQQEVYRRQGANLIAVRLALLEVPGVRDVQILNLARGTGTLDVLIYGFDRVVSDDIVEECQRVLDETVSAGVSAIAKAPVVKFIDVDVQLRLKQNVSLGTVRPLVSSAIRGYLDNLPIEDGTGNGTLIFQELSARIQQASSDIVDSTVKMTVDNLPALRSNQTVDAGERIVSRTVNIV